MRTVISHIVVVVAVSIMSPFLCRPRLPGASVASGGGYIFAGTVIRGVWEGHWAEETVILTDGALSFFSPLSSHHYLFLPMQEIMGISQVLQQNKEVLSANSVTH